MALWWIAHAPHTAERAVGMCAIVCVCVRARAFLCVGACAFLSMFVRVSESACVSEAVVCAGERIRESGMILIGHN